MQVARVSGRHQFPHHQPHHGELGYQFIDSTVSSFPANPALVGNQIPLVPQNEFTFQGTWAAPQKIFVAIQGRTESNEFDDDQNLLPLGA